MAHRMPQSPTAEHDTHVVRARTRVASARAVAAGGRQASAERMLRDALGIFERRQLYGGAARAAATLGLLLRERGDAARAGAVLQRARTLCDTLRADSANGASERPAGREWEDYEAARALLAQPVEPATACRRQPRGDVLDSVAGETISLLHAVDMGAHDDGAAASLCRVLQQVAGARAAAAWRFGRPPVLLAAAGQSGNQLVEAVREPVGAGRCAPLVAAGRGYCTAVPVQVDGSPAGALLLHWLRAPIAVERPVALARIAAAMLEPVVRAAAGGPSEASATESMLLGGSPEMAALRTSIARAADAPYPALIAGETGTGKELVARALHQQGPRRAQPFCALNCAALTDDLFEAELFGHSRGAFTGALAERRGLLEASDRGTLFLDEVGELSPRAQAKLLRVVQEGEVRRLGENAVRQVDVRLLAATNRDLAAEVAAGRFRQDLLFRLAVVCLTAPPLRERIGDVELLLRHFWTRELKRAGKRAVLDPAALDALRRYRWPGNVRELQNVVARLVVAAPRRGVVGAGALPAAVRACADEQPQTLAVARLAFERRFVHAALVRNGGRPVAAAGELGLSRQGLAKLVKRLDVACGDASAA